VVFFAVRLYLLVFLLARQQVATGDAVHNAAFG
jgi:hypothetical protein